MNFKQLSIAALLAVSGFAANATVTASLGGDTNASTFITLDSNDVVGRNGSNVLYSGSPVYAYGTSQQLGTPTGAVGSFIAAGPTVPGGDATFTLPTPSNYVSFEWGSVNTYNTLYVFQGTGAATVVTPFTTATFPSLVLNQDQYVSFNVTSGPAITALVLESSQYAFEAANFSVTAVPEPSNIALMLAGLGAFGLVARKRRV